MQMLNDNAREHLPVHFSSVMKSEKADVRFRARLSAIVTEAISKGCSEFRYSRSKTSRLIYLSFRNRAGTVRMRRSISLAAFPNDNEPFFADAFEAMLKSSIEIYIAATLDCSETRRGCTTGVIP